MALTVSQQAAYDTLVAQGRTEFANQFAAAMTAVNAGVPMEQATQAAFSAPAPAPTITESTTTATNYNPYFTANPDVAAAYLQNTYGLTPEQFAQTHYQNYGQNEGRAAPTSLAQDYSFQMPAGFNPAGGGLPAITSFKPPELTGDYAKAATDAAAPTLKYYTGKTYQGDQVLNLAKQLATIADPSQIKGGVFGEKKPSVGFDYSEAQKILGGEPTVYDQVLLDSAANLIDQGITDLSQLKPSTYTDPETGEVISQNSLFAGQTYSGPGVTNYQIQFDASGKPKFTTTGADTGDKGLIAPLALGASLLGAPALLGSALAPGAAAATQGALGGALLGGGTAALSGGNVLQGAVLGGLGGYAQGGGFSSGADLGMNSNLTMAQIEAGLGTPGYGYGAQAANSGLFDPAIIGSGAYLQTSYPYDMADFLAADVQNLYSQVGSNIPAIEQNLIASGVDPLVAADVANTITLNPNISTYDLTNYINTTFGGGNIYDVNATTQYPTSTLPGEGGLLSNVPTTTPTTAPTTTTTPPGTKVVDPDVAKLIASGITKILPGLLTASALSQMTNKPSVGGLPTQGVPTNSPEYYQAIQQYYNTYMPEQPRDVATPLQQWYDSKYGA